MDIKAIAFDMDGTLLNSSNYISRETIQILEKLRGKGIKVFLATGRTLHEIQELLPKGLCFDGAVTSNGMGCYKQVQTIFQHSLDPILVEKAIKLARNNEVYYEMHTIDGRRIALLSDKDYMKDEIMGELPNTVPKNEMKSRTEAINHKIEWVKEVNWGEIVQMYFFSLDLDKINSWQRILENLKVDLKFTASSSSQHNVEIMKDKVSKATGLKVLLREYGMVANQLMVYGDGENDISMFQLAKYSVAMKNATDYVKEKATSVTDFTNDENGVYKDLLEHRHMFISFG